MERFYRRIAMPVTLWELLGREVTDEEIEILVDKCSLGGKITIGAMEVLNADDMREIYKMAR
jgi:alcohol dehydrogenase YqhD (iron-dependent ADH family)